MADCPRCGDLLSEHGCGACREDLATMFATMTKDLAQLIDRRLEVMKKEILKALKEQRK